MKTKYKGFELEVKNEKCLGGWKQKYMTAYHDYLGEVLCYFSDDEDTVFEHMKILKSEVDDLIKNPDDYDISMEQIDKIKKYFQLKGEFLN